MQRFTNLDRAEVLPVDLNSLLRDVASIVGDSVERGQAFEFRLETLPSVEVRPQLISAVFSALFQNALDATPEENPVRITSAIDGDSVRIEIWSGGKRLSDAELEAALDPGFRVKDGRVAACNWSVFSASQVVREHGGEISLASGESGTVVRVSLPAKRLSVS
jgi:signal transduction histidine kinase